VINLMWVAIVIGFFLAVAWVIYKLFRPKNALN
jgi:flagellar biogenesis protein FliO